MSNDVTESELRSILAKIIERGAFPDERVVIGDIERIPVGGFSVVDGGKVRFQIEKLCCLARAQSQDGSASDSIPEFCIYELDPGPAQVSLVKKEYGKPSVNYERLATEKFAHWDEWSDYEQDFSQIRFETAITDFAGREFEAFDWIKMWSYDDIAKAVPGFKENFLRESKRQFIYRVFRAWKSYWRKKNEEY